MSWEIRSNPERFADGRGETCAMRGDG